jgi:hypothetical protein
MATTDTKQAWARGGLIFAATLLILIGVYQFFMGLAAVVRDEFYIVGANYYYTVDTSTWGWIHMGIGVVALLAGFFLFTGATWARWLAIAIVVVSAIANFFYLPYYPLWSMLLIAVDIFAIWAIATARVRDEFAPDQRMEAGYGTGTPGTPGTAAGVGAGAYAGDRTQTGERWPSENVQSGRHWAPQDVKEGAGQTAEEAQQQAQHAAQSGQQYPRRETPPRDR